MIKKVCVVGGGNWGKNHVKTLHELNSLGGVVDKDRNLLENYKKKYPYVDTFDDLELHSYGFGYHRDLNFPQDDENWFLLEKKNDDKLL